MTYHTDNLLAAIRREHSCPDCTGRNNAAGTEAAKPWEVGLPASPGGVEGDSTPPVFPEPDPLD